MPYVVKGSLNTQKIIQVSSLEQVLTIIISHIGEKPCVCQNADQWWSFLSQILTVPLLWQIFPHLKVVGLLNYGLASLVKLYTVSVQVVL